MYQSSYAEVMREAPEDTRGNERRAFDEAIRLLVAAEEAGRESRAAVEAIHYVRRLWTLLIQDPGNAENDLPAPLRANLISIGIWTLREAEAIRMERSHNFRGLIEINTMVQEGLR
jgi:flagellar protein FlaF